MQQEFQTLIRSSGYRLTPQRQLILDAVREAHGHSTPEEIYRRVQEKMPVSNRATVYRTLEFLLKLGLVTTAHDKDNQIIYEIAGQQPHHHLVCQRCDHVEQIDHAYVAASFDAIEQQFGFKINSDHLMLFGVCRACYKNTKVVIK